MSLKTYKQKRIFKSTPEPFGEKKNNKKNNLNFVIQKHQASHLHYDFRLESEGVLKSWAVPKGIPRPGEKRLAMMVEDHPLEYRNFEGIIPEGNFGAGKVIVWDNGTYSTKESGDRKKMSQLIDEGEIKFFLSGKKIKGEFSLVKLKKAQENSWLFIAKKNEENLENVDDRSVVSGRTLEEIGSENFQSSKYPLAVKSEMPSFIYPMLAVLGEGPFNDDAWIFEIKWDGYRILAQKKGKKVNLYSRNKKNFNETFFNIIESIKKIKGDFIIDGEIIVTNQEGASNFQMLQNYMSSRKGTLIYQVFDIVYLNGYDLKQVPLIQRKEILKQLIKEHENIRISDYIEENGIDLFENIKKHGGEGIIGKKKNGPYRENYRSRDWLKIKTVLTQDAVIGGFTSPRGGRKGFGALVLGVYENAKLIYIGHVGGGFNDINLRQLTEKLKSLVVQDSPFEKKQKTNMPVQWIRPELVCEVKFSEWTSEGILRQPIFLGMRYDKDPLSTRRELIKKDQNKEKKKFGILDSTVEKKIAGKKIILTNMEKIYFPKEGYTKGDVVSYYEKISKYILPYLIDHPQSLNRFPNGIEGKSFFQKDMTDTPSWIRTVKVFSPSEERTINYMLCQNEASLLYMANLGCIELNIWNSSIKDLDKPDYMVFDIDPQNLPFESAVQVAKATKVVLDEIKIKGFCKTSGSRGLHIFVPLGNKYSFDQVKEFSRLVNLIVNKRLPEITSIERKPELRNRKVYLDYLQNRKGQTMAAAYCLRPRNGAPVSAPIDWNELNEKLDPLSFNIETIFRRLEEKGDLWKGFFDKKNRANLKRALGTLEKIIAKQKNQL